MNNCNKCNAALGCVVLSFFAFTLRKIKRLTQVLPWICEHGICVQGFGLLVFKIEAMVNRNSWGHLNSIVRGEILGFIEAKLLR